MAKTQTPTMNELLEQHRRADSRNTNCWIIGTAVLMVLAFAAGGLLLGGCCEEKPSLAARYGDSANWRPYELPELCHPWLNPGCDLICIGAFENN